MTKSEVINTLTSTAGGMVLLIKEEMRTVPSYTIKVSPLQVHANQRTHGRTHYLREEEDSRIHDSGRVCCIRTGQRTRIVLSLKIGTPSIPIGESATPPQIRKRRACGCVLNCTQRDHVRRYSERDGIQTRNPLALQPRRKPPLPQEKPPRLRRRNSPPR